MNRRTTTRDGASRRAFLRGLGVCVALPTLESLAPVRALAAPAGMGETAAGMPMRMAFVAFPNGSNYERWKPEGEGRDYKASETFAPMESLRSKFQIITNLAHDAANNWGDGPGDHARAGATFLTGAHAWKTRGAQLKLGTSVDQIAAAHVGGKTRIDSLQLGTHSSRLYGACDSGYACAYQYNLSWASETTPLPPETDPRVVFEKLFGGAPGSDREASLRRRLQGRKSVLDFVMEDARDLRKSLGRNDRAKVDEYLTGVRALEERIQKHERFRAPDAPFAAPSGIPKGHGDHVDLMYDLMAVAFQTDSTRVVSFCVAPEGSNIPIPEAGISEGHHFLTHHSGNEEKREKVGRIDRWYMERFARFLSKLDAMKDADGSTVLDNAMVVYGSGIGDGNRHNHDQLPVALAGGGGGSLTPGRHLSLPAATPMTNLYTALLDRVGVRVDHVGDSTGRLEDV